MRIDQLKPGTRVTLRYHGSMGNLTHDGDAEFVRITGDGDDRRAVFTEPSIGEWEAYRYDGRWAYGSSADRLQLVSHAD